MVHCCIAGSCYLINELLFYIYLIFKISYYIIYTGNYSFMKIIYTISVGVCILNS